MVKNVIWFANINTIGGVESVMWNVVRKYKDKDITIWYRTADKTQLQRLRKYVRLIKFNPDTVIECDTLFINFGYDVIKNHYKAKRVIYMVHANYKYLQDKFGSKPCTEPDFEYYAVSQWAADNYYAVSGIMPKLCYNPIIIDDDRKALLIVSATRIPKSKDKGALCERMKMLADRLDVRNIPFLWLVFTNSDETVDNKNIINVPSRLDIIPFLRKADFVAQLSDTEAFCMTALETATIGTPLLVTKIPSFMEMGLDDTNAIYFDFDMSNMDECIDKMITKKFNFKYTPNDDIWGELLAKGKKEYSINLVTVKALKRFRDVEEDVVRNVDEMWEVFIERADDLVEKNLVEIVEKKEEKYDKSKKSKRRA